MAARKELMHKYRSVNKLVESALDTSVNADGVVLDELVQHDITTDSSVFNDNDTNTSGMVSDNDMDDPDFIDTHRCVSSDCEENDDASDTVTPTLTEELASWASARQIPRSTIAEILGILQRHGHPDLPTDPRTLLGTPQSIEHDAICGGRFVYFGLKSQIMDELKTLPHFWNTHAKLDLSIGIDGVPLSKSSGLCLWPILGRFSSSSVFNIGVFCGEHEPNS